MSDAEFLKHKQNMERARNIALEKLKILNSDFFETYKGNRPDHLANLKLKVAESTDILNEAEMFAYGFQIDTTILRYHVQAYTAKNRCGAVIKEGDKILGWISYRNLIKEEIASTRAIKKSLQDPFFSGLYSALIQKFTENLPVPKDSLGRPIYVGLIKEIYMASTFLGAEYSSLESFVELLSGYFDIDKVTVCSYFLLPGLLSKKQRSGISRIQSKFSAEKKGINKLWGETKNIKDLEERIHIIAEKANLDSITTCRYVSNTDSISKEQIKGINNIKSKLLAQGKGITKVWDQTQHIKDLEERIKTIAELTNLDPTTACTWLTSPEILTKKERAGINRVRSKLSAEKKQIQAFWDETRDIVDLKERILLIAKKIALDPVTTCRYVVHTYSISKEIRKKVNSLRSSFFAQKKEIKKFWDETGHISDLGDRISSITYLTNLSPATICSYLLAPGLLSKKQRSGIPGIQSKFSAEKKGIKELWYETQNIKDLEERIRVIGAKSDLDPSTVCHYLQAPGILPKDQRKGLSSLLSLFVSENK